MGLTSGILSFFRNGDLRHFLIQQHLVDPHAVICQIIPCRGGAPDLCEKSILIGFPRHPVALLPPVIPLGPSSLVVTPHQCHHPITFTPTYPHSTLHRTTTDSYTHFQFPHPTSSHCAHPTAYNPYPSPSPSPLILQAPSSLVATASVVPIQQHDVCDAWAWAGADDHSGRCSYY